MSGLWCCGTRKEPVPKDVRDTMADLLSRVEQEAAAVDPVPVGWWEGWRVLQAPTKVPT